MNQFFAYKTQGYPDNCPTGWFGGWVKVRVCFKVGGWGNQTMAFEENCPRLGLEFGFGLVLGLEGGAGGEEAIFV